MLKEFETELREYKEYLYFLNIINNFKNTNNIYWSQLYKENKQQVLNIWEQEFIKIWSKIKPWLIESGFQTMLFEPKYFERKINNLRTISNKVDYQTKLGYLECEFCETIPMIKVLNNYESFNCHRYQAWVFDTLEILKRNRYCPAIELAIEEMETIKKEKQPTLTYDLPK